MALPAIGDTWELDGVTFNSGDNGDGFSYLVKTSSGWDGSAPPRPEVINRPGDHGGYRSANYRAPRVVTLDGIAQAPSRAARDDLKIKLEALIADPAALYELVKTTRTRALTLFVERSDTINVIDLPDGRTVEFNLQVVATDPRKYSSDVKSGVTVLAQAPTEGAWWSGPAGTTGAEWNGPASPTTGMVWQASSGTSGTITLDNAGITAAPILFTIDAPSSGTLLSPSIVRIDTGETITYGGTMVPGDQLVINTGTGLTRLNGTDVGALLTQSQFFEVPRLGSITVQFLANGPAATAQLTAQWTDTY